MWAEGMYSFRFTKVVRNAVNNYRILLVQVDGSDRITYKMFWHVPVLTLFLDDILSKKTFPGFSTLRI